MTLFNSKYLLKHSSLPKAFLKQLAGYGIVYVSQLIEMVDTHPTLVQRATGMGKEQVKSLIKKEFGQIPAMAAFT